MFYPDNVKRRDRALELQNDIASFQNKAKEARKLIDKQDDRMLPFIDSVLQKQGVATFEQVQAKLNSVLTGDQKKALQDVGATSHSFFGLSPWSAPPPEPA